MATLVLSTFGAALGGPVGGSIGAFVGQQIDQRYLFAPKGTRGPRLGDLSVQTSAYGSQVPRIFGTMRVAGTVIWATDLVENKRKQSAGKGRGSSTTYSYSASFAVALSGRPIADVRRIWADGKLLRGASGDLKSETRYRLYLGGETQPVDPLIAAAEGIASTPAFRDTAYAVFEAFQLGDYGNRIPSLTFEVVADEAGTATGEIIQALTAGGMAAEPGAALTGFAAHGDSVRAVIASLSAAVPVPLYDDGERLRVGAGGGDPRIIMSGAADETTRVAAGQVPDAVTIGYYDPARDYQAGLQRAQHAFGSGGPGRRVEEITLAAAIDAPAAKALAAAKLDHHWRTRERRMLTLAWSAMDVRPGMLVRLADDARLYLVTGWTLERMAVRLELKPHASAGATRLPAQPGRSVSVVDDVQGPTTLHVFDAPSLDDSLVAVPRLLVAASGASRGWRGAVLEASSDGGSSWQAAGATAPAAVTGVATSRLGAAGSTLFDAKNSVDIDLVDDDMWLENCTDDALVGGTNLAVLGGELLQFGRALPLGAGRFRLSRLLRGRRGSEWAVAGHAVGDRFTLIEAESLVSLAMPLAGIGGVAEIAARGIGDGDTPAVATATIGIEAIRPPSPVHWRWRSGPDGALTIAWTRRSRTGWGWIDGMDAPLGEAGEAYRVTIGGVHGRVVEVGTSSLTYTADAQAADAQAGDALGGQFEVEIVQLGSAAASRPLRLTIKH